MDPKLKLQHLWQVLLARLSPINVSVIFLVSLAFIFILKKITRDKKINLPPSPPKRPFIGNLHQLGTLSHRALRSLSNKYGRVMFMQLGHVPTIVVSSAELVKEMVQDHDIVISNRRQTMAANIFMYGCVNVGFAPYGEYWRQVRKTCVLELLSVKRVHSFQRVRDDEVATLIEKVGRSCTNGTSANLTGLTIDVSNQIVSRCVIGAKSDEEGEKNFGELSRKMVIQLLSFNVNDFFPSLGWLDVFTGLVSKLKRTSTEFDLLLDRVIEEHKLSKSKDRSDMDFVDILLQLQRDNLLDFDLTQDNLKAILMDMLVAGIETSSTTAEWTMAELVRNPTIMKKAQAEVRRVVSEKGKIKETDIAQMGYIKCVIKEALRLHPPLPFLIPRELSSSIKLGGYDIPAKTQVMINTWAIHTDPELWDKPDEFIPERFENSLVDFKGHDFQYIPFGVGRRGCPGMSFGIASVECIVANLLYWFDWELADGVSSENIDMSEVYGITVQKKVPLHLVPKMHFPC